MVHVNGRRILEQRRGRRVVALVAFLLLAAQAGFGLHAAGHATLEGSASCAVCLTADQPMATAPQLAPVAATIPCEGESPTRCGALRCRDAFLLPPARGPPTHS